MEREVEAPMAETPTTRTREAGAVVLTVLATQQLLMAYDSTAMNVAISDIVDDLGATLTGVQSAISLYALVMAALMRTGIQVTAVSDDDLRGALQTRGVGGSAAEELVRVNARAREAGITAAMIAMAACGLVGAAVALRLPRTAGRPSDAGGG